MTRRLLPRRAVARRILMAGFLLAAGAFTRGEDPLTPGELGTARFRAEALITLRDKVESDRAAVNQARTRFDERTGQMDRRRNDLDAFLRGNGVDPAQIARIGEPDPILLFAYSEAVLNVMWNERERAKQQARKNTSAGGARNDPAAGQINAQPEEYPEDAGPDWSSLQEYVRQELRRHLDALYEARHELNVARGELERAEDQLDWHLRYYDEDELKRLQKLLARVDADAGTAETPPAPDTPAEAPSAVTSGEPVSAEVPPDGFGDAGAVAVAPMDGTAPPVLPAMTSEALLARFNDACSVRNWALAEDTLAEAARGASWHETGVRALQHERERAAEGDQMHFTKCLELEGALLAAGRRGDWTAVQAFAAQARQEGCRLRPEAQSEIQRSVDQQRRQDLIDFTMQQMLYRIILNPNPFDPLHDQPCTGPHAPRTPPSPARPPSRPDKPPRQPTRGGPVSGRGGT